jgi:hypothetical protein
MSLINISYFIGEKVIPNATYPDVLTQVNNIIQVREREYLINAMGYEMFKSFWAGIAVATPLQKYVDILLGTEFTGMNGRLKKWDGLISITQASLQLTVSLSGANDIFFTVDGPGGPADNATTYVNTALAGLDYRVSQRGYGGLEQLKSDNSNVSTANIRINNTGGFTWLNGVTFTHLDKYQIELFSTTVDVGAYSPVAVPESPIADYVYFYWLKHLHTQSAGVGTVQPVAENAKMVSPKHKAVKAWNDMTEKTCVLKEFLQVNYTVYPEFQNYAGSRELFYLTSKMNIFF